MAPSHLPPDANVATLIDHDSHYWKDNLIDFLFMPSEAALIKSIPLPSSASNDSLIWSKTTMGQLTAKSAYHFLWEEQANLPSIPSSSSSTRLRLFWKSLWAVHVPNKIKTFVWRVCSNILPTLTNLWKKEIVAIVSCYLCGDEAETVGHVLWSCPSAKSIWRSTPLFSKLLIGCIMDFQDVMDSALTNLPSLDIEMVVTLAWLIWKTQRSQPVTTKIGSPLPQHWDHPQEGFYKGSIFEIGMGKCQLLYLNGEVVESTEFLLGGGLPLHSCGMFQPISAIPTEKRGQMCHGSGLGSSRH
ncbi:putative ribonuclease h protein [Fagus crenata]